jgi:hypothetical protein
MRRKGSSFHQIRKRIPIDVLDKARGSHPRIYSTSVIKGKTQAVAFHSSSK